MATSRQKMREESQGAGEGQSTLPSAPRPESGHTQTEQTMRVARSGQHRSEEQRTGLRNTNADKLARGLGWFSIGLGLAEVLAPRVVAKIAGTEGKHTALIRLFGLREIASGVGIFMQGERPVEAVWARVAGDALDIASLAVAFASPKSSKGRVAFATANVLAVTALDVLCAQQLSNNTGGGNLVKKSIIIDSSPEELYEFWHNFENLPRFMKHLESVRVTDNKRSHWVAKAPAGKTVEWDAEVTAERPGEMIAWRSLEGADVDNTGSVRFERAPGNRGTIVKVEIEYSPPGGVIGATVAKLFGEDPEQQVSDDLRCLKQVIEIGEVIISDGTVWDNGLLTQRAAQPVSSEEIGRSQGVASA